MHGVIIIILIHIYIICIFYKIGHNIIYISNSYGFSQFISITLSNSLYFYGFQISNLNESHIFDFNCIYNNFANFQVNQSHGACIYFSEIIFMNIMQSSFISCFSDMTGTGLIFYYLNSPSTNYSVLHIQFNNFNKIIIDKHNSVKFHNKPS